jgi:hypothetical protein
VFVISELTNKAIDFMKSQNVIFPETWGPKPSLGQLGQHAGQTWTGEVEGIT